MFKVYTTKPACTSAFDNQSYIRYYFQNSECKPALKQDKWPNVDIVEYPNYYIIEAEVPGFKKENLDISFDNVENTITLKGEYVEKPNKHETAVLVENENENENENNPEKENDNPESINTSSNAEYGKQLITERNSKKNFRRSFKVKQQIVIEEIEAELNDGILSLLIPKHIKEEDKETKIPIQ
ncbi:HSP20-like chaperone [Neoconidiobolus thromboides FSU 785]|nr:HSP20-like chaperone [Neoconidiobolus thromboides FSU 785]